MLLYEKLGVTTVDQPIDAIRQERPRDLKGFGLPEHRLQGPDGSPDLSDEFLGDSHSHCDQSRNELTRRLIRACENPYVAVIGHPTTCRPGQTPGRLGRCALIASDRSVRMASQPPRGQNKLALCAGRLAVCDVGASDVG
jgi:hypothetical protein